MIDRIWFWSVWVFGATGLAFLLIHPEVFLQGRGFPSSPAGVHLLTLGVLLGGYFPLSARTWRTAYGPNRFAEALSWLIWALHVSGAGLFCWGLFGAGAGPTFLGGHYLIPFAVGFSWLQGGVWAYKRPPGTARALKTHLPGLGLLVVMPLGVMLMMDRFGGQYGFYGQFSILLHLTAGAYLFILPAQWLGGGRTATGMDPAVIWTAVASLGIMAMALSGRGFDGGLPLGLALLGAVSLWIGIPGRNQWRAPAMAQLRRWPWAGVGLLLLYGALGVLRDRSPSETSGLVSAIVTLFLLGVGLPDWFYRLGHLSGDTNGGVQAALRTPLQTAIPIYGTQLVATAAVLGGIFSASTPVIQAGLVLWLASLAALALVRAGLVRPEGLPSPARRSRR